MPGNASKAGRSVRAQGVHKRSPRMKRPHEAPLPTEAQRWTEACRQTNRSRRITHRPGRIPPSPRVPSPGGSNHDGGMEARDIGHSLRRWTRSEPSTGGP